MSRWSFSNDLEDQLRYFLRRVVHGHREKTPGEVVVLDALKPHGGELGTACVFSALGGWGIYVLPSTQGAALGVICVGLWLCIRPGRSRSYLRKKILLGWVLVLAGFSAAMMHHRSDQHSNALRMNLAESWAEIVEIEGMVLAKPASRPPVTSSLDRFRHAGTSVYSEIRIYSLKTKDCLYADLDLILPFRCDHGTGGLGAGDEICARGRLESFVRPVNPGNQYEKSEQPTFKLIITDPRLIRRIEARHPWRACWLRIRSHIRDCFCDAANTISGDGLQRRAFIHMLLLGQSVEGHDELRKKFSEAGLSHVLAISGLHLAVVAIAIRMMCMMFTSNSRLSALVTLGILFLYAVILEPRSSIHRSVLMIGIVLFGHACSRYWRSDRVCFVAFYCVLVAFPEAIKDPGFQLTFSVTAGLIILSPVFRMRWFGTPDRIGRSRRSILTSWMCDAFSTSLIAWLVGCPLVLFHFGQIAPAGIFAAIMESIPVFIALIIGFPSMLVAAVFGITDMPGHRVLSIIIDVIFMIADVSAWCMPAFKTSPPSAMWVVAMWASVICAVKCPNIRWRRMSWVLVLIFLAVPFVSRRIENTHSSFSMSSFSVGNGSAILIRSGNTAILYDAGSTTFSSVGSRIIIPALHELGIRRLDACVISHMNLDHVSGIEDILSSFDVSKVIVSHQLKNHAEAHPEKLAGAVWSCLSSHSGDILEVSRGDTVAIGTLVLNVFHPGKFGVHQCRNDESLVIQITSCVEPGTILLCGDAEEGALNAVLAMHPQIECDVLELPHHGSWSTVAATFVRQTNPKAVIQSTGHHRFRRDRWEAELKNRIRYVTCRDGACTVELKDVLSFRKTEDPLRNRALPQPPVGTTPP